MALMCGHPLKSENLEPSGKYLRCKECRRSAQNAWHQAKGARPRKPRELTRVSQEPDRKSVWRDRYGEVWCYRYEFDHGQPYEGWGSPGRSVLRPWSLVKEYFSDSFPWLLELV